MIKYGGIIFLILLASCSSEKNDHSFMTCRVLEPSTLAYMHSTYSFEYDFEESYLYWVENSSEFKVNRNTSSEFWASAENLEIQYDDSALDINGIKFIDLRLNRIMGTFEIAIEFNNKSCDQYTSKELEKMEAGRTNPDWPIWCETKPVPIIQTGTCKIVERKI